MYFIDIYMATWSYTSLMKINWPRQSKGSGGWQGVADAVWQHGERDNEKFSSHVAICFPCWETNACDQYDPPHYYELSPPR